MAMIYLVKQCSILQNDWAPSSRPDGAPPRGLPQALFSEVGPRDGLPGEPLHGMTPEAGLPRGFVYADGRRPRHMGRQADRSAPA